MRLPVAGLWVLLALTSAAPTPALVTKPDHLVFQPPGSITIEQVDGEHVTVRGRSTLPNGTCLGSEL